MSNERGHNGGAGLVNQSVLVMSLVEDTDKTCGGFIPGRLSEPVQRTQLTDSNSSPETGTLFKTLPAVCRDRSGIWLTLPVRGLESAVGCTSSRIYICPGASGTIIG
jgi:hypothetical protein